MTFKRCIVERNGLKKKMAAFRGCHPHAVTPFGQGCFSDRSKKRTLFLVYLHVNYRKVQKGQKN